MKPSPRAFRDTVTYCTALCISDCWMSFLFCSNFTLIQQYSLEVQGAFTIHTRPKFTTCFWSQKQAQQNLCEKLRLQRISPLKQLENRKLRHFEQGLRIQKYTKLGCLQDVSKSRLFFPLQSQLYYASGKQRLTYLAGLRQPFKKGKYQKATCTLLKVNISAEDQMQQFRNEDMRQNYVVKYSDSTSQHFSSEFQTKTLKNLPVCILRQGYLVAEEHSELKRQLPVR